MAHQVETMAYAGQVPWHGLGVPVSNDLTPQQMQEKAGLNWKVRELDSFIEIDGEKTLTGLKSLVREDNKKILTNVGENWNPVPRRQTGCRQGPRIFLSRPPRPQAGIPRSLDSAYQRCCPAPRHDLFAVHERGQAGRDRG